MTQNSTAKISLTPGDAKALHRQMSAAIDYVETNPARLTKDSKGVLADAAITKKVLGKISTALRGL